MFFPRFPYAYRQPVRYRNIRYLGLLAALLILPLLIIQPTYAASIMVDSLADTVVDDGACTLREAIINANSDDQSGSADCTSGSGADVITFSVNGTVTLGSALPEITSEMTIDGAGQSVIVSGDNAFRVIIVNASGTLNLNALTITDGFIDAFNEHGGGILNFGTLNIGNSTFTGNSAASEAGGAIQNRGGSATITNSTFTGNSAGFGGALYNYGGPLTVSNSTIANNGGGGIAILNGPVNLQNTIVASNQSGSDCVSLQGDNATADSHNMDSDGTCDNATTQTAVQLNLGSLADNGGETQTIALLAGSTAIDIGDDTLCPTSDQRGVTRPQGSACDIGAFEAEITETDLSITKTDDSDPLPGGLILNYTIAVANNGSIAAENVVVTDILPAGVRLLSSTGDCTNSPTGATPTCELGTIDAGTSKQFELFVAVDGAISGTITNEASVTSDTPDPDPSNNSTTEDTVITFAGQPTIAIETLVSVDGGTTFVDADTAPGPDLAQGGPAPQFRYEVSSIHPQGTNQGVPLSNVIVTDSVLGTITGPASGDDGNGILDLGETWVYLTSGTFGAGQNSHTGSADGDFTPNGGSTVAAPTATDDANYVGLAPDLSITKADDLDPIPSGLILDYTITVANNGSIAAENVVVTDILPAGVRLLSSSNDCTNTPSGATPTCQLGTIDAGTAKEFHLVVAVDGATSGTITNQASVTSDTPEPDLSNNTVSEDTLVTFAGQPTIAIETLVSVDGGTTYVDADTAPGPDLAQGGPAPQFRYEVSSIHPQGTNQGVPLSNVIVTDSVLGTITGPATGDDGNGILDLGETWIYLASGMFGAGQNTHTGSADGDFTPNSGSPVAAPTATDDANYFGVELVNEPPTAEAGGRYVVDEGSSVQLDGSGSSDPDQDAATLSYAWDFNNDGSYDDATGVNPTFTATDGPASATVGLQVTDDGGLTSTDAATVDINNVVPTANAGPDQSVFRNETVNLSGTWSDPAGAADNAYTWSWDLDGDGTVDDGGSANFGESINRTTSFAVDGVANLTFTVTDKDGGSSSDTVQITVINRAPVADNQDLSTDEDTALPITLSGSDADGDALTFSIFSQPGNGTLSGTAPNLTFTPDAGFNGTDSFTFQANDGVAESNVATITITVTAVEKPFITCGGYEVFETVPGVYEAPGFSGTLIVGTDGGDWLTGTSGPDLIVGLQGPDDIRGRQGNDVICGGAGVDIIEGEQGNDFLYGGPQDDWLIGGNGNDTLLGGLGWDDLEGNNGADILHGGKGYDVLLGGKGNDTLSGNEGPDDLYGNKGDDNLNGGGGNDFCKGGPGTDTIDECEGVSAASVESSGEVEAIAIEIARRSNDGDNGEHAIEGRIQDLYLPMITGNGQ